MFHAFGETFYSIFAAFAQSDTIEYGARIEVPDAEQLREQFQVFDAGHLLVQVGDLEADADLRLQWQEFLLRIIADAFDLPPLFLGLEHDVNRATASELSDTAFHMAIVPTARLFAEHLTRDAIGKRLGWHDLEFVFNDVDAPNEREQAEIQEILLRSGVLTVKEARRMRGLPEL